MPHTQEASILGVKRGKEKKSELKEEEASVGMCSQESFVSNVVLRASETFHHGKIIIKKILEAQKYLRARNAVFEGWQGRRRTCVCEGLLVAIHRRCESRRRAREKKDEEKWKLFSFPIYVTSKAFVSQQCRTVRRRAKAETTFTS